MKSFLVCNPLVAFSLNLLEQDTEFARLFPCYADFFSLSMLVWGHDAENEDNSATSSTRPQGGRHNIRNGMGQKHVMQRGEAGV